MRTIYYFRWLIVFISLFVLFPYYLNLIFLDNILGSFALGIGIFFAKINYVLLPFLGSILLIFNIIVWYKNKSIDNLLWIIICTLLPILSLILISNKLHGNFIL